MSNKTSDKNVANDIKILNKFCEYEDAVVLTDNALEEVQDAMKDILAEREQDKKRIQELEKENADLKKYNKTVSDRIVEYKKNSIPKQAVIDLMENETINISGFECIAVEDLEKIIGG